MLTFDDCKRRYSERSLVLQKGRSMSEQLLRDHYIALVYNTDRTTGIPERPDTYAGQIVYAEDQLNEALTDWDRFNKAQGNKYDEPKSHFAETINQWMARLEVLNAERALIEELLDGRVPTFKTRIRRNKLVWGRR